MPPDSPRSGPAGRLREGIDLFNRRLYFEAHEAFEDLWRAAAGAERDVYQGIVQACAGLVKHQRGEPGPALTLLARGLSKLPAGAEGTGCGVDLPHLAAQLRSILDALAGSRPFAPPVMRPSGDLYSR